MLSLPRLLENTIPRERLCVWLDAYKQLPLRVVLAPTGFGKTTGLIHYASGLQTPVLYVALRQETNAAAFLAALGEHFQLKNPEYQDVFWALEAYPSCECIIDGIECLREDAVTVLERLSCELPAKIGIIAAGTRTTLDLSRYLLRGFAKLYPAEEMLFSRDELKLLADGMAMDTTHEICEDLRDRTDGWPIVASDVLRLAQGERLEANEAYEHWMRMRGEAFSGLLQDELTKSCEQTRDVLTAMFGGLTPNDLHTERLIADGAPIIRERGYARVLRVVTDLQQATTQVPVTYDEPLRIRMFGRFSVRVSDREVQWIRRRDQQLIRYLLLRPDGSADKSDIMTLFWPDADPQLAAQSLRTACSTIRKALATSLGPEYVDRFFAVDGSQVFVKIAGAVIDVHRFRAHIHAAQNAELSGDVLSVLAHVAAAERIYRADLFAGEPPDPWFAPQREAYREMREYAASMRARLRKRDQQATLL